LPPFFQRTKSSEKIHQKQLPLCLVFSSLSVLSALVALLSTFLLSLFSLPFSFLTSSFVLSALAALLSLLHIPFVLFSLLFSLPSLSPFLFSGCTLLSLLFFLLLSFFSSLLLSGHLFFRLSLLSFHHL
jgi:hypothetical protein